MNGTIRQRSPGSWEIQVFLGRGPDGKRRRKTETVRGKKADAERRRREILSDLDHGISPPQKSYKLTEWLKSWMDDVIVPRSRQKTIDRYRGIINKHIVPHFGNIELARLTPAQVQKFDSLLQREKQMAPAGVNLVHRVLSGALKHAVNMELIHRNPAAQVSPPPGTKSEAETPDIEQVRLLLAEAKSQEHYLWPCIHLIVYTGMRRGEALALKWSDLDLDKQCLRVTSSLVVTADGLSLVPPKTSSGRRTIDLDCGTIAVLQYHQNRQEMLAEKLRIPVPDIVFPRDSLETWCHPNTFSHALSSLCKKAGCQGITSRSLRHFHASVALENEKNIVKVSKRLGHKKVSTTLDIYAHVLPGWQMETAEAFAEAMDPNC